MSTAARLVDLRAAPAEGARTRWAVPALAPAAGGHRVGHGEVFAHHGEILQGVFYTTDGTLEQGLVTLPCALFDARARFRPTRSGPLTIEPGNRVRARAAARQTLEVLGKTGWGGSIRVEGNVPLAWGCGSSTMDVLAVIRAVADAFGAVLEPEWVAKIAVAAETASDSLMYGPERAVLFAQRRGALLADLGGPLPLAQVLGFNTDLDDGGLETLKLPPCRYTPWEVEAFQPMLGLLRHAVEAQDAALLGRVATASTLINQRHRPKRLVPDLLRVAAEVGAVGTQVAHSGTVAGFLFDPADDPEGRAERARAALRGLGVRRSWRFTTDGVTHPEAVP